MWQQISTLGHSLGPPWIKDQKTAALLRWSFWQTSKHDFRQSSSEEGSTSEKKLRPCSSLRKPWTSRSINLIVLDDALNGLAKVDSQQCRIVELRFFRGLSIEETSQVLGMSPTTLKRNWNTAKL